MCVEKRVEVGKWWVMQFSMIATFSGLRSSSCQLARECTHAGCCAALGCSNEIMEVGYDHRMYIIHCSSVVFFTILYFACV